MPAHSPVRVPRAVLPSPRAPPCAGMPHAIRRAGAAVCGALDDAAHDAMRLSRGVQSYGRRGSSCCYAGPLPLREQRPLSASPELRARTAHALPRGAPSGLAASSAASSHSRHDAERAHASSHAPRAEVPWRREARPRQTFREDEEPAACAGAFAPAQVGRVDSTWADFRRWQRAAEPLQGIVHESCTGVAMRVPPKLNAMTASA